ncbi:hypothetical protein J8F10_22625 [Gemmata sp. G18]|uniref:Uncharacterized protein n=1 Tax=Gemmata palustris TaxID=2822762 RepID=A0ABS5BWE6_9BACT|nr:hypothetical protein [Gemmata palustris]MBP3958059.1 hypothetical protein [Gemmata palustris]
MLGEPEPVREALEKFTPGPDDDVYPIIEIAWQSGVLPKKGFDLVLDRHGICSAITMVSGSDLGSNPELREYCVGRLAAALHAQQLTERLKGDLAGRDLPVPDSASVSQLVNAHPELFADDAYHIDTSHLSSVVQMSTYLPAGPALNHARELCVYGRKLAPNLQGNNDAPFEENYDDYLAYLNVLGEKVEEGLARFAAKAEREAAEGATYAAQVYVNLLLRANRVDEALQGRQEVPARGRRPQLDLPRCERTGAAPATSPHWPKPPKPVMTPSASSRGSSPPRVVTPVPGLTISRARPGAGPAPPGRLSPGQSRDFAPGITRAITKHSSTAPRTCPT